MGNANYTGWYYAAANRTARERPFAIDLEYRDSRRMQAASSSSWPRGQWLVAEYFAAP